MNKKEAIQAMLNGEKVKGKGWIDEYIFYNEHENKFMDELCEPVDLNDFSNTKIYSIHQPPKQKVKKWLWICKDNYGPEFISACLYENEEEAQKRTNHRVIKRADWSEIEVEE